VFVRNPSPLEETMHRPPLALAPCVCLALTLVACGGGGGSSCPEGTVNCACRTDPSTGLGTGGTCDAGLSCTDGFCVAAATCPDGAEGCPCYANGTCDSKDGVVMACEQDVCVVPGTPPQGDLGDACDADRPCGTHDGAQLECREGTCQLPVTCPAGTFGCPCDAGTCQAGLACVADACQAAAGGGLVVDSADVRACDVLLEGAAGVEAQYGAAVLGVTARDGARLALSFAARTDAALTAPVAALVDGGTGEALAAGAVTVSTVTCYDRHGAAVAAPGVELK
jgi:hypothetical protein